MKNKLHYLFPLALILVLGMAGCVKTGDNAATALAVPTGNYSGQFLVVHKTKATSKLDTPVRINLALSMSTATGFAIMGDTALHAASRGNFALDSYYVQFDDVTYPTLGLPTKYHLNGLYEYLNSGSSFRIGRVFSDTVNYFYNFNKN